MSKLTLRETCDSVHASLPFSNMPGNFRERCLQTSEPFPSLAERLFDLLYAAMPLFHQLTILSGAKERNERFEVRDTQERESL
jgi:hypothetical protein